MLLQQFPRRRALEDFIDDEICGVCSRSTGYPVAKDQSAVVNEGPGRNVTERGRLHHDNIHHCFAWSDTEANRCKALQVMTSLLRIGGL